VITDHGEMVMGGRQMESWKLGKALGYGQGLSVPDISVPPARHFWILPASDELNCFCAYPRSVHFSWPQIFCLRCLGEREGRCTGGMTARTLVSSRCVTDRNIHRTFRFESKIQRLSWADLSQAILSVTILLGMPRNDDSIVINGSTKYYDPAYDLLAVFLPRNLLSGLTTLKY